MSDPAPKAPEISPHLKSFVPASMSSKELGHALLLSLVPEAVQTAAIRFTDGLMAARDQDWTAAVQKIEVAQWRLGMEDAAKLVCTICARGEKPLGRKEDEKAVRVFIHPAPVVGKEASKSFVRCTAAAIYETLEPKA